MQCLEGGLQLCDVLQLAWFQVGGHVRHVATPELPIDGLCNSQTPLAGSCD